MEDVVATFPLDGVIAIASVNDFRCIGRNEVLIRGLFITGKDGGPCVGTNACARTVIPV